MTVSDFESFEQKLLKQLSHSGRASSHTMDTQQYGSCSVHCVLKPSKTSDRAGSHTQQTDSHSANRALLA